MTDLNESIRKLNEYAAWLKTFPSGDKADLTAGRGDEPTPPVDPDVHHYLSTACFHGWHERCRKTCKFCFAACSCDCHQVPVSS